MFKLCRDAYQSRFSELETIITNAFDFARIVKELGNDVDSDRVQDLPWLSNQTKMSLTVASQHFKDESKKLTASEWESVVRLCDEVISLEEARQKLLEFLTNRTHVIAPNTSKLVGAAICAKLIAAAGGLHELSLMPACNI